MKLYLLENKGLNQGNFDLRNNKLGITGDLSWFEKTTFY